MALAEVVLRKVKRLGLVPKIISIIPIISLLLAISSVGWLLLLPIQGNFRNTYMSENALMPGQVTSYFRESEWNLVRGYRSEVTKLEKLSLPDRNKEIEKWLEDIGLKTSNYVNDKGQNTLYGIMNAPRGDDTEAMILAAPWRTSNSRYNIGGVTLGVALLRYFTKMSIWSKNIIVVFPEDGHTSLRSWVEAYHSSLDRTAGSVEAAVIMEFEDDSDYFDYFELNYEGLNGQVPNLDLLNTVITVGSNEGISASVQQTPANVLEKNDYESRLKILIKGIINLAFAGLSRTTLGCEAFSGWQIQAFTIKARGTGGPADITLFGRLVDSTFRSVNNLLERFHQSFFFYFLLSPRHFVSIGTYLPSAILLAVALALSALSCFLHDYTITTRKIIDNVSRLLVIMTSIEVVCFILSFALPYMTQEAYSDDDISVRVVLYSLTSFCVLISLLTLFRQTITKKLRLNETLTYLLVAASLYLLSMLITALLIVHFALAVTVGLFALPLSFIPSIITTRSGKGIQNTPKNINAKIAFCLIASCPFIIIYPAGYLYAHHDGVFTIMRGLLNSWRELQCWTWFIVILCWFPAWLGVAFACATGKFLIDPETISKEKKTE